MVWFLDQDFSTDTMSQTDWIQSKIENATHTYLVCGWNVNDFSCILK
jgi:hypothetical protein